LPRAERLLPRLSLLLLAALLALSAWQWRDGAPLDASVLGLLPQGAEDALVGQAQARMAEPLNREVLILVGHPERGIAIAQVEALAAQWQSHTIFERVQWRFAEDVDALRDALLNNRLALLPAADRTLLISQPDEWINQRLAQLFDPFESISLIPLEQDWLGFAARAQDTLSHARTQLDLSSGALLVDDGNLTWALLRARTREDAFDMQAAPVMADLVAQARREIETGGGHLLAASGLLYAAAGQRQAILEMTRLGTLAALGIIALLLLAFRRARVLLALLPVAVAILAGACACIAIFGRINALTLVLGASLIGVAVDAPLHYLSKSWRGEWRSWQALRTTLPGLSLSLASNLIGYLALAFTPFPALTQIAVFSVAGLLAAYLCAVCLLPAGWRSLSLTPSPVWLKLCTVLLALRTRILDKTGTAPLLILLLLLIGGGLWQVHTQNDPRQWLGRNPGLQAQAQKIAELTGEQPTSQFFLLRGDNEAQLLQRQAALSAQLDGLYTHRALSQLISAPSQTTELHAALRHLPEHWQPLLAAGIPQAALQAELDTLLQTPAPTIEQALSTPLGEPWQPLWLGQTEHGVAGLVSLQGQIERAQLQAIAESLDGVQLIDRLGELDTLFAATQFSAATLKLLACVAIMALLWLPFGLKGALRVIALPLLAAFAALACLGWLGEPLTLFSLFALLLVTAIGVDYAILMRENIGGPAVSLLGTLLAALTSWLSFGLLLMSQTPVIANFGLTISLGLLFCFLFAPWASPVEKESHASN